MKLIKKMILSIWYIDLSLNNVSIKVDWMISQPILNMNRKYMDLRHDIDENFQVIWNYLILSNKIIHKFL